MDDSERPFKVDGRKVWLSQTAREYAREWFGPGRKGERQMANYLMQQEQLRAAEGEDQSATLFPEPSGESEGDFLPDVLLGESEENQWP